MPGAVLITGCSAGIRIARLDVAGMSLWPDAVRELGDAIGDGAAVSGPGDAIVERSKDIRIACYERAEAHREHDGDHQRPYFVISTRSPHRSHHPYTRA